VLITGAAGGIGSCLREGLRPLVDELVLTDKRTLEPVPGDPRVVFASSSHAAGFYPVEQTLTGREPPRPDSLYGVTKAYGEALGHLYADKFGLKWSVSGSAAFSNDPYRCAISRRG
jgi:nucleoside-diphosphate-sugar epimerase